MSEVFSWSENLNSNTERQKNNPLTKKQLEDFSKSQRLYKERLKLVEQRTNLRERNYDKAKQLLQENPNEIHFTKYEWKYYKDFGEVVAETWKNQINVYYVRKRELENFVVDFEKEEIIGKNIKDLLKNNPNIKTFYELDWRYYISNPTRVPWNDVWSILRVKQVSRDELEAKLEWFEKWNIESISLRLDRLIANTNNWNVRNYLMDLRSNISLNWNNDFILTFWERLWNLLNLFEKAEIKPLTISEIWEVILLSFNLLRSWISDLTKIIINYIKDLSSSKLYKFWNEDSEYEKYIRDSFEKWNIWDVISLLNGIMPENYVKNIREVWIDTTSMPLALSAWWIDWTFDYVQASVDIVVIPDTVIQNVLELWLEIKNNWGELFKELFKSFEKSSDAMYVIWYIISVILCFIYYPSKLWALALPNTIMKWLEMSWKIPANMMWNIEHFLSKNLTKLEVFLNNKVKWASVSAKWIIKWWEKAGEKLALSRDWVDSSNTLMNSIQTNAKMLKSSREALAITNNSLKLAQIFWESIVWRTNEALTTKNAMNAYKEMILKWNWFNTNDIDVLIEKTKWETRYNLVLVREKLQEVEKVMDWEVLPVWNKDKEYKNNKILKAKLAYEISKNLRKYNILSQEIFKKYIM